MALGSINFVVTNLARKYFSLHATVDLLHWPHLDPVPRSLWLCPVPMVMETRSCLVALVVVAMTSPDQESVAVETLIPLTQQL